MLSPGPIEEKPRDTRAPSAQDILLHQLLKLRIGDPQEFGEDVGVMLSQEGCPVLHPTHVGAALTVKEFQFFEAAKAVGCGQRRVVRYYILPNIFGPLMVIATINGGGVIIAELSLSFLGFGVPPPEPSWGRMIAKEARPYFESAPWMAAFPGLAISLAVFSFNMLGDALRDVLDPRLRRG